MTITFKIFDEFQKSVGKKLIDLSADSFKAILSSVAPNQDTSLVSTDITQISATGGYAPLVLTSVTWVESGSETGIWQFSSANLAWTASGASFDSFRYITIYDDTSAAKNLVGFYDRGSGLVLTDGATYTVTVSGSGHFQMSHTP